jgi:hypothetical protein
LTDKKLILIIQEIEIPIEVLRIAGQGPAILLTERPDPVSTEEVLTEQSIEIIPLQETGLRSTEVILLEERQQRQEEIILQVTDHQLIQADPLLTEVL